MISLLSSLFLAFFHTIIYIWAFIITLIRPVQAQVKKLTRRNNVQCQGCIVVVSPTFYKSTSEVRFTLAQRLASQVRRAGMTWIVVDASPGEEVRDALQSYGAIVHREQPSNEGKGKGVGLRQAIKAAVTYIEEESRQPGSTVTLANSIIVAMEPEKESFLDFVPDLIVPIVRDQADVVLPTRRTMHTLPREQYHSESFGNAHLNNVAREVGFPDNIDWYFGPFLWRASLSPYWLAYRGLLWESQIVPYIYAWKEKQAQIVTQMVDFTYPREQKLEEEGNAMWSGKRLFQLHHLIPHIVDALRDEHHPSSTFNGSTSFKRR